MKKGVQPGKNASVSKPKEDQRRQADEAMLGLWLLLITVQWAVIYLPLMEEPLDLTTAYLGLLGLTILWLPVRVGLSRGNPQA
ncbi:MAG: hypothetical protein IT210_05470 [Armatimonadetes bacterium]|nr:hypothetical protein [Armatimonadota bacterium]